MTQLLYLTDMLSLTCTAKVEEVLEENGKQVVILNQTVFYPQGGGQPYDTGTISSETATFLVEEVRYFEGSVKHIGIFEKGTFEKGESVTCAVNKDRRLLNSKLHSAGHLVDMAVYALYPEWTPGKGFHFPDGPYVEYIAVIPEQDKETIAKKLEELGNKYIQEELITATALVTKEQLKDYCRHVPTNIPEGKPIRIVSFADFGVPCGGTHVSNLKDLKYITIRKVKQEKDRVRVSYDITR